MAMYRNIEEEWERQQEEKESKKRVEAAKRKIEHEVLVRIPRHLSISAVAASLLKDTELQ